MHNQDIDTEVENSCWNVYKNKPTTSDHSCWSDADKFCIYMIVQKQVVITTPRWFIWDVLPCPSVQQGDKSTFYKLWRRF